MTAASGLKNVGRSAVNTVLDRVGRGMGKVQERTPLPYDLLESDDAYLVVFDAPGATRSDVQVRYRDGAVEVQVDRFREYHEGFEMRFPGRGLALDGRAELPPGANVDPGEATAQLDDDGTLRVELPKVETATSVDITEESEGESVGLDHGEPAAEETGGETGEDVGEETGGREATDEGETTDTTGTGATEAGEDEERDVAEDDEE